MGSERQIERRTLGMMTANFLLEHFAPKVAMLQLRIIEQLRRIIHLGGVYTRLLEIAHQLSGILRASPLRKMGMQVRLVLLATKPCGKEGAPCPPGRPHCHCQALPLCVIVNADRAPRIRLAAWEDIMRCGGRVAIALPGANTPQQLVFENSGRDEVHATLI